VPWSGRPREKGRNPRGSPVLKKGKVAAGLTKSPERMPAKSGCTAQLPALAMRVWGELL